MSQFICALLTYSVICCSLAKSNEFVTSSEFVKKQSENKSLANIVRNKNSSKSYLNSIVSGNEKFDRLDKQSRASDQRSESKGSSCCGSKYGSNSSMRPDSYYSRIPVENNRYPIKFDERLPIDRYGWQTQGSSAGSTKRPGSVFYEGSIIGDSIRFGSRPNYGSESSRKPNGYDSSVSGEYGYVNNGYGGYSFNRPTNYGGSGSSYGISGTFANGEEFGPVEPNHPEGHAPSHPNIQAQKAVALKALAGVALIGAAAALATNPVLLPLGVVSGRRKRSSVKDKDAYMNYILANLKSNITKKENGNETSLTPPCIARFTCEIQWNYWFNHRKDVDFFIGKLALERQLNNLLLNNISKELENVRIKKLLKTATIIGSNGGNCNILTCTLIKNKKAKNLSIFKF
ncbi:uncharacterized protein LOC100576994 isoform X2 [Apis mellifera]|uniref:Uncharacterized protein LOC100576994 isoform X2 n=1 Tax=Apis mellifera TaxID=7460 RepID=A0A7M7LLW6_APIME|nr:uncharacterized protein LOC100576994 isoform X2 [Apis mellifera]|eukprot:XP_006557904.3 uncharacterized protein LOC100576994 isoform X2 [Apis mellifera]